MKKNTRKRSVQHPDTAQKKKQQEYEKERLKRKKCRDKNKNSESCNYCSLADKCSVEATEDYLKSRSDGVAQ